MDVPSSCVYICGKVLKGVLFALEVPEVAGTQPNQ